MTEQLTKRSVAKRQLVTAINLFFANGDPVSIFSLAANAWEVIDELCTLENVGSASNETRSHLAAGKDLKYDYVNSPFRNFFKHADRDPQGVLDGFSDEHCDGLIFLATEDYIRLNHASPVELQVFQLWYLGAYFEKVAEDSLDKILDGIHEHFPKLRTSTRLEQKAMGLNAISEAYKDHEFLADPMVEAAA